MPQTNYQVAHQISGRIRIKIPKIIKPKQSREKLHQKLLGIQGVTQIQINPIAESVVINYRERLLSQAALLEQLAIVLQEFTVPEPATAESRSELTESHLEEKVNQSEPPLRQRETPARDDLPTPPKPKRSHSPQPEITFPKPAAEANPELSLRELAANQAQEEINPDPQLVIQPEESTAVVLPTSPNPKASRRRQPRKAKARKPRQGTSKAPKEDPEN